MGGGEHRTLAQLQEGMDEILRAPADAGAIELLVRRPGVDEREELSRGELGVQEGLVGDGWRERALAKLETNAQPSFETQLTLMNVRVLRLMAGPKQRWALAGDQVFVDLDLRPENLPPGTRLALGSAEIEIASQPHNGCKKFAERFGEDAFAWVRSDAGRAVNLRGIYAKVISAGSVAVGDRVRKLGPPLS